MSKQTVSARRSSIASFVFFVVFLLGLVPLFLEYIGFFEPEDWDAYLRSKSSSSQLFGEGLVRVVSFVAIAVFVSVPAAFFSLCFGIEVLWYTKATIITVVPTALFLLGLGYGAILLWIRVGQP